MFEFDEFICFFLRIFVGKNFCFVLNFGWVKHNIVQNHIGY